MTPVKLDPFQGHIVLMCKNWYKYDDFFDALIKLWGVRCGVEYKLFDTSVYASIADSMFDIIVEYKSDNIRNTIYKIHNDLYETWNKPKNLTPIESLIWQYRSIIACMKVKDANGNWLLDLPKPNKRVLNRIFRGNGRYSDYELINNT